MCPLKREQATRMSYNTLTHSRLYCSRDKEEKVGHELKQYFELFDITNSKRQMSLLVNKY